jgi:uncharacterized membrane protein
MNSYGKLLVPYDLRTPTFGRTRERLWNARDERFVVPAVFGLGWSVNLRSAPRHPVQALLLAAFVLWRLGRSRRD